MKLFQINQKSELGFHCMITGIIAFSYFISQPYLLLLLTISLCLIMWHDKNIDNVTALLFFILPFSSILKLEPGSQSLYKILEIAFLFIFLFRGYKIDCKLLLKIFVFIFYCITTSLFIDDIQISKIANLFLWLLIILCIFSQNSPSKLKLIGKSFIAGVILSSTLGLFANYLGNLSVFLGEATVLDEVYADYTNRFMGLWNDPNTFAVFICMAILTNFALFKRKNQSNPGFLVNGVILTIFGLLSLSKMCIIILLIVWSFIFIKSRISNLKKILLIIPVVGSIVTFMYFYPEIFQLAFGRFNVVFTNNFDIDILTTGRYSLWLLYIDAIKEGFVFWFGNGISNYLPLGRAAHNTYLQIIYHLGIIGLMLFIWLLLSLSKMALNVKNNSKISEEGMDYLPIFILFSIAFFLDYFFIENFYFLFVLAILSFCKEWHTV